MKIIQTAKVYNSTLGSVAIAFVRFKTISDVDVVQERKRVVV